MQLSRLRVKRSILASLSQPCCQPPAVFQKLVPIPAKVQEMQKLPVWLLFWLLRTLDESMFEVSEGFEGLSVACQALQVIPEEPQKIKER